jgi:hypothetical protein
VVQLNRLIERLCDAGVDFVIVGGFAGVLHGSSLVTRDLDVCAVLSAQNIAKLRTALGDLHPIHRLTPQRLSFMDTPEPGLDMEPLPRVISLQDLIQAKEALGREKDLLAAQQLRVIAEKRK